MRRLTLALGGLLAAAATTLVARSRGHRAETGSVYVVHGIPNTPVDVYVDGAHALDRAGQEAQARSILPAGARQVAIFPADAADGSGSPLLSATPEVPAGGNVTLVAHPGPGGKPTVTPFVNDVSAVPAGQARVVVRHTAAAPAVDVLAGGTCGERADQPERRGPAGAAGTISAAVAAGTTDPVIGPAGLDLQEGTATFVHAIGSLQDNTLGLVVVTIDGLHSSPSGVPSGAPSGARSSPVSRPASFSSPGPARRSRAPRRPARPALTCLAPR